MTAGGIGMTAKEKYNSLLPLKETETKKNISKLRCVTTKCKHHDIQSGRNCRDWSPGRQCGFKDISTYNKEYAQFVHQIINGSPEQKVKVKDSLNDMVEWFGHPVSLSEMRVDWADPEVVHPDGTDRVHTDPPEGREDLWREEWLDSLARGDYKRERVPLDVGSKAERCPDCGWNPRGGCDCEDVGPFVEKPPEVEYERIIDSITVDMVNAPPHYMFTGNLEVIDVIKIAVEKNFAEDGVAGGSYWQVLKYLLRCGCKGKCLEDLKKAEFYLKDLIKEVTNGSV
jgi:hypothetical protein